METEFDDVIDRLQDMEALDWEVKEARGGIPHAIWETISAFANTRGGWLVLGVSERTDPPTVVGVADARAMVRQLHDLMRNRSKISEPVCGATDIHSMATNGRTIVALRVPALSRRQRPVYTRDNPYGGTFIRRDEGDYLATRPEVDRMMREAAEIAADDVILPGYGMDDLDVSAVRRYRQRFQNRQPDSPHNDLDDDAFLGRIGAFRRDRGAGLDGLTVAGLLMFGTEEAIRSWRSRHLLDYRLLEGPAWELGQTEWKDRLEWEGCLLGAYDEFYRRLTEGILVPFSVVNGVRLGESDQHIAVREALVNMLVHADYAERESSLAFRSAHGFFFRNPGNSRVIDLDSVIGDKSDPRNPTLARMFRLIGVAEEAGSGVPRIRQALRRQGYEAPRFNVGNRDYAFSTELRLVHLLSESDRIWLSSLGEELADEEQVALVTALRRGEVDNRTLRELTGSHRADTTQVLVRLRDLGLFSKLGERRDASYRVADMAVTKAYAASVDGIHESYPEPNNLVAKPTELDGEPNNLPPEFEPETNNLAMEPAEFGRLVTTRWGDLMNIVESQGGNRRRSLQEHGAMIAELCRVVPLTTRELAILLELSNYQVRTILKKLIGIGVVSYLYPDTPNHPAQRYLAGI